MGNYCLIGYKVSIWGNENLWKYSNYRCQIINIINVTEFVYFKMVKWYILYIFYYIRKKE